MFVQNKFCTFCLFLVGISWNFTSNSLVRAVMVIVFFVFGANSLGLLKVYGNDVSKGFGF